MPPTLLQGSKPLLVPPFGIFADAAIHFTISAYGLAAVRRRSVIDVPSIQPVKKGLPSVTTLSNRHPPPTGNNGNVHTLATAQGDDPHLPHWSAVTYRLRRGYRLRIVPLGRAPLT